MPKTTKMDPRRSAKVWLFSLAELPGFCRRHKAIVGRLDTAYLAMPMMLFAWRGKAAAVDEWVDALFRRLPESRTCTPGDEKRMFGLIDKLEKLLDKTDYVFDDLEGAGLPSSYPAFHTSASLEAVQRALKKVMRVDRTAFVWSYLAANNLGWVTES